MAVQGRVLGASSRRQVLELVVDYGHLSGTLSADGILPRPGSGGLSESIRHHCSFLDASEGTIPIVWRQARDRCGNGH
jgi:hypothetical protein